jgi:hypothetical protein
MNTFKVLLVITTIFVVCFDTTMAVRNHYQHKCTLNTFPCCQLPYLCPIKPQPGGSNG